MAYTGRHEVVIFETSIFTRRVEQILTQEEHRLLQLRLALQPSAGRVIRGSGGLRKLRWPARGRGKRGGARVIYYWMRDRSELLMLFIYSKTDQNDLTREQLRILRKVVKEGLK
jgi:hypothetical protein